MARDAAIWRWQSNVRDDIRQTVVERGWYGRETPTDVDYDGEEKIPTWQEFDAQQASERAEQDSEDHEALYGQDAGLDEDQDADFDAVYGQDPEPVEASYEPEIEQEMD